MALEGNKNLSYGERVMILQGKEVLPVGEYELIREGGEVLHLEGQLVPLDTFVPEALLEEWDQADLAGDFGRAGEILAQVHRLAAGRGLDIGLKKTVLYAFRR